VVVPATRIAIGDVIAGRYQIAAPLGSGAMGTVYRARHLRLPRNVAIKILHADYINSPKLLRRFEREALLAARLNHHNVVPVIDFGETDDGVHYIVMELADGPTLGDVMSEVGVMPVPRVIELVKQLCSGLDHAHNHGLVHRDFKPDNVIIERVGDEERARIIDFGISTLREEPPDGEKLTTVGLVLGTPHYMAPEHVSGQPIDHRIDLFALGIVVYEMLTGRLPFDGNGAEVARANLLLDPPPMRERAPGVDIDPLLEAFTRRLLAKLPDERPSSAFAARLMIELIGRDRVAAATLLGVDPSPYAPPMIVHETPTTAVVAAATVLLPSHLAPTIKTPMPLPKGLFKRRWPWIAVGGALAVGAIALSQCASSVVVKSPTRDAGSISTARAETDE